MTKNDNIQKKWLEEMQEIANYTCEIQTALQAEEKIGELDATEVLKTLKWNYKRMSTLSAHLSDEIHTLMQIVTEICENQND